MRLKFAYLFRNILRNSRRTLLTCAAVALPIIIVVLTTSVIDGINRFLENSTRQLRLAITHKTSIINPMPAGHRSKIETLDPTRKRLISVCGFRWLGGKVENDPRPLAILAADHDTFAATFPEHLVGAGEAEAWLRDRQAILMGRAAAAQFGWEVGDRITVRPSVPPYTPMQFNIVALTGPDVADAITSFCRRDYVEEEIKNQGWIPDLCSFFFVKCASSADLDRYRVQIDELFANTPDATFTQDEKAFMNQFITQQFNLPRNLTILGTLTVLVAILAATNTMGLNFRDRLNEYATLRAMGFRSSLVLGLIQFESLAVCTLGGLIGALAPYIAFTHTPLRHWTVPLIQTLEIRPMVCVYSIGIAMVIGLLAAAWPAWLAARLKPVEAFRMLE